MSIGVQALAMFEEIFKAVRDRLFRPHRPMLRSLLAFEDAEEQELKGVPDAWRLYRVVES